MPENVRPAVREAALDILLNQGIEMPPSNVVAAQAGVPIAEVEQILNRGTEWFYTAMLWPFLEAVDDNLKALPLHSSPGLAEQREILDRIVTASVSTRRQLLLLLGMIADRDNEQFRTHIDRFTYQAAVRLLGTDYDPGSSRMVRVRLTIELLAVAVSSRPAEALAPGTTEKDVLVDSLLGTLNPPHSGPRPRP